MAWARNTSLPHYLRGKLLRGETEGRRRRAGEEKERRKREGGAREKREDRRRREGRKGEWGGGER